MRTGLGRFAIAALVAAAACCAPAPKSEAERTVSDSARGVRYVTPPRWRSSDGEVRSPSGTLLTLRVYDLVEADKKFVAGLPDTLLPQLVEWSKFYYIVDGDPVRSATTVAGLPATEFDFPIRVRPQDPPSKVLYWVVTRKTRLFVIRGAFPASALAAEEPVPEDR
jgi:hypothetical protein